MDDAAAAERAALRAALKEALDTWAGFAHGIQSPAYQGPSEIKGRVHVARIAELRKLLR